MHTWTVEKARVLLMMHLFRDLTVKAYYSSAYCTSNILKLTTLPVLRMGATAGLWWDMEIGLWLWYDNKNES